MPVELMKQAAQIVVRSRVAGIAGDCLREPLLGLWQPSGLDGNDAHQEQGIEYIVFFSQYLPADLLGKRSIAALQDSKGLLRQGLNKECA